MQGVCVVKRAAHSTAQQALLACSVRARGDVWKLVHVRLPREKNPSSCHVAEGKGWVLVSSSNRTVRLAPATVTKLVFAE
ncbi:hypothetical protein E2C01_041097 [Portunus trituberculatus]|uniref:Uncharacterized protein n=1 Tax=Portunus trituberculatus TaxID=210409 RepID=A0A5B7FQJ7_PORTR|nr:hypothetical protein [Portunus trituberculatus]